MPKTYKEGQTATNPNTGERVIYQGGKWMPLPANARPEGSKRVLGTPETRAKVELGFDNMVQGQRRLEEMESQGYSLNRDWGARLLDQPEKGDWINLSGIGRAWGGDDYQRYMGSAKSVESALLPVFSGAAVTESEANRYIQANAPQMGDTAETAKMKSDNRKRMINAAAVIGGKPIPFPEVGTLQMGGVGAGTTAQASAPAPQGSPRKAPPRLSDQGFNSKPRRPLKSQAPRKSSGTAIKQKYGLE